MSIQYLDSNPQSLECKSPPIGIRPRLPNFLFVKGKREIAQKSLVHIKVKNLLVPNKLVTV